MKKILAALCLMMSVPTLAFAAGQSMVSVSELHQQAETLGRWQKKYETPNGEVNVDIPILVPDVEAVPILQVSAIMGKEIAEAKGLPQSADQENAGAGIFYDDCEILSKLNVETGGPAVIFCANPKEIDFAFLQVNLDEPVAKRRGWDYSIVDYDPSEVNPETLFAEENDQPLAAANDTLAALLQNYYGSENADYIRGVYALRLGYVCYLDDTSPDTYTLYPAWVCDCIYADSPREQIMENVATDAFRENYRYEQILLDAQTCAIQSGWIDRDEGLYHAEPMTWEDAR